MLKKSNINQVFYIMGLFMMVLMFSVLPYLKSYAKEPYIIVIDPGHGGENLGAAFDGYTEKEMTLQVAYAMKEELERYENVIVYLTHDTDTDMAIRDRALFAKEKKADLLLSLHFNASVNHDLYGAEVWVPAYDQYYMLGRMFAEIEMELLTGEGIYSRGIKTRLNNYDNDYYGILRYCSQEGVPSVLIEHCHMDNHMDTPFFTKSDEQLKTFGQLDAQAVAKFFGLSSKELAVDYQAFPLPEVEKPPIGEPVRPDKTKPEVCTIEVLSVNEQKGKVSVRTQATDTDNYIQYYRYSIDGGKSYSSLQKWPRPFWNHSDEEHIFTLSVPFEQELELIVKAYNAFDIDTESNSILLPPLYMSQAKEDAQKSPVLTEKTYIEAVNYQQENKHVGLQINDKMQLIILIVIISIIMTFILFLMIKMIGLLKADNMRHKKRKE